MPPDYPWAETLPAPGRTIEVAPGIHWLRMPLPFALDHINLWLLEDGEGWCIVDTGYGVEATFALWRELFAGTMQGRAVTRIIVTHHHPDHVGSAVWLQQQTGAQVWMSQGEWATAHVIHASLGDTSREGNLAFMSRNGLPPQRVEALATRRGAFSNGVPAVPASFMRMMDGDAIQVGQRTWHAITAFGHAPEHISLYSAEGDGGAVLISGDQVLPRITTNVSVWASQPDADPLSQFLSSLKHFEHCASDTLVLPSHDRVFRGLHARLAELSTHHDGRLQRLLDALAEPLSGYDAIRYLFKREMDDHQIMFALGESLAHLHHLWRSGRACRTAGGDGVLRFVAAR